MNAQRARQTPVNMKTTTVAVLLAALVGGAQAVALFLVTQATAFGANVLDFGAMGDGTTDDTAAFNAAAATGETVFVPYTPSGYVVNNIEVFSGMEFVGDNRRTQLIVTQNNAGAFLHSSASALFDLSIKNFLIRPENTSVVGCSAYKQTYKDTYSAYVNFENIETYLDFPISYDGFFIYTNWKNCRDGYCGNLNVGGSHMGISSCPAISDWASQGNQTNLCSVKDTQFFGATGTAAVDIGWGVLWSFKNTDFEAMSAQAIRARGVYHVAFEHCWFERIASTYAVTAEISPGASGPQGTNISFKNCWGLQPGTTGFVYCGAASSASFQDVQLAQIPSGYTLANAPSAVKYAINVGGFGVGTSTLTTGYNTQNYNDAKTFINGATDDGSGAVFQLSGKSRASDGFTSNYNITVSTSWVTIGKYNFTGGVAVVNGYNTSGGNTGVWLIGFRNGLSQQWAGSDATQTTPQWRVIDGNLQMKTSTGTLQVSVALLI